MVFGLAVIGLHNFKTSINQDVKSSVKKCLNDIYNGTIEIFNKYASHLCMLSLESQNDVNRKIYGSPNDCNRIQ